MENYDNAYSGKQTAIYKAGAGIKGNDRSRKGKKEILYIAFREKNQEM